MEEIFNDEINLSRIIILLKQSNYSQVIKEGKKYLKLLPDNAQLRAMISVAYQNQGKKHDSLFYSEQAIAMDPVDPYCLYIHAKALFLNGHSDTGIKFLNHAIEINPLQASYLGLKAAYLLEKGNLSDAEKLVNEALQIDPENSSCKNIKLICGQLLSENEPGNDFSENQSTLNASGFFTRGYNAYLSGNAEDAIHFIKKSLNLNPNNDYARRLLTESYKMQSAFYRKYILNLVDARFKKNTAPNPYYTSVFGILFIGYIFLLLIEFTITPTGIDRFYILTFPFIAFAVNIIIMRMIYPLSNLMLINRSKLWGMLQKDQKKITLSIFTGTILSLILFSAGIYFNTEWLIILSITILQLLSVISGKPSVLLKLNQYFSIENLLLIIGLSIVPMSFFRIIGLKQALIIFLVLFYFSLFILQKRAQKKILAYILLLHFLRFFPFNI
jgi:tetratricopeptide (TPR) repeat protein